MDSISLARKGASVTGIDFSKESIKKARELNELAATEVRFIECDVYSLKDFLTEKFDIVYTSYGVVGWLPDLKKWADIISSFLKPRGRFIMIEFHPVVWMFSDDFQKIAYNYSDSEPIIEELGGTYTDGQSDIKSKSISWNHGLAKVINALIDMGLNITGIQEYNYSPYDCFKNTVEIEKGKYQIAGLENRIPMLYSVTAENP